MSHPDILPPDCVDHIPYLDFCCDCAIGGCFGVASFFYVRRQTTLMNSQVRSEENRKADDAEWSAKFEEAATSLARVGPKWISGTEGEFYHSQFTDLNVRTRIEQHLFHIERQNRDISKRNLSIRSSCASQLFAKPLKKY
jgi:hypothetical protein